MELAVEFRWKVVVLDDERIKEDSIEKMEAFGVDVSALGRPKESLLTAGMSVVGAHFVYCDMNWKFLGRAGDPSKPLSIPDSVGSLPDKFVQDWIAAVRYWTAETAPELNPARKEWPRARILEDHIGLWLAAMVKHLSPSAVIILYSSHPQVAGTGELAAIGRFPDTPFEVETKDPEDPLPIENFKELLKTAQKQYLNARPDLRSWFLSDVLIRTIAGAKPVSAELMNVGAQKNERATFTAESFFPNFFTEAQFNPAGMNDLLEFLSRDMPVWQETALHSLNHKLLELKEAKKDAITEGDSLVVCSLCNECGEAGILIRNMLDKHFQAIGAKESPWLDEGLQICHASLSSRETDLIKLCRAYGGSAVYQEAAQDFEPGQEDESKTNPQLPFQYFFLRRAVDALMHNARNYAAPDPILPAKKLEAEIDANTLAIAWSDNSQGFVNMQEFTRKLRESVTDKGSMRGLPLALLFGLRFNAIRIEVLIRDSGGSAGNWHTLWPYGDYSIRKTIDDRISFGFRWTFRHELP